MTANFSGSQIGGETTTPLSYTGSPWQLLLHDLALFFRWCYYLPNIVLPIWPCPSGSLDELYPSPANLYTMFLHLVAIIAQSVFIVSLPLLLYIPFTWYATYIVGFLWLNDAFCKLLNGHVPPEGLPSTEDDFSRSWEKHDDESWIFLNGVAVGQHWLQCNIDRLSRTFHRPIVGVHNKTSGIIFDVIQCLIQRTLLYATSDVRDCYVLVKKALYHEDVKKVVLVLHSQGGIEGSMILDWLLNEVPQNLLGQLEVYTFGNAANHFNNPYHNAKSSAAAVVGKRPTQTFDRAIAHLEHYANSRDFVSRWGVLNYTQTMPRDPFENRFMGRVFERPGSGHQFNQHYLDNMFPLDASCRFVREAVEGDFMDSDVEEREGASPRESVLQSEVNGSGSPGREGEDEEVMLLNMSPTSARSDQSEPAKWRTAAAWVANGHANGTEGRAPKAKELSRLWAYRNGMSPPEKRVGVGRRGQSRWPT